MTDTVACLVHPGETWEPRGYPGLRDEVLHLLTIDGDQHVVWRGQHSRPQVSTVADFVTDHCNPRLPIPESEERVEYAAYVRDDAGWLHEMSPWPSVREAYQQAVRLRGFDAVVGMVRIVSTRSYEWVAYEEEASPAEAIVTQVGNV